MTELIRVLLYALFFFIVGYGIGKERGRKEERISYKIKRALGKKKGKKND